jgi:hypothetical protein
VVFPRFRVHELIDSVEIVLCESDRSAIASVWPSARFALLVHSASPPDSLDAVASLFCDILSGVVEITL